MMEPEAQSISEQKANPLGTESIGTLLLRFSVPSMVAMLVNSLYNIVDQIFIGQGVGYIGNAATNVAFPFVTLSMAVALLIADGCASTMSLKLGAGDRESAERGVGNSLVLSLIAGLAILLIGQLFLTPFLRLFGATESVLPYAQDYTRIILIGIPFMAMGTVLSSLIRADGSPKFSMICMLIGAVINTVLDPVFIFVFKWGVQGAAFATILGQIVTMLVASTYLRRTQHITIHKRNLRLRGETVLSICALGISSCITQLAICLVQIVLNNTVRHYGALSPYGADIPLSAFGIVMKVNQIMISLIVGLASGAQPIVGFNYGAGKYHRVKETYRTAVLAGSFFAVTGWVVFHFFPQNVIALFGQEDALYNEFAMMCFQTSLFCVFCNGFQIVTSIFFQSIGKAGQSAVLSLSRQTIFLVPLLLILPLFGGLNGALYAMPIADAAAAVLAAILIVREMRVLNRQMKEQGETVPASA